MIDGTNLNILQAGRQLLRAFGGVNETYGCSEAELSREMNFSSRGYPALQTRAPRRKTREVKDVNGMYHLNGFCSAGAPRWSTRRTQMTPAAGLWCWKML